MCRPRKYDRRQEREIGRAVVEARRLGIAWKLLMRRYELGRTRLYELAKQAEAERPKG